MQKGSAEASVQHGISAVSTDSLGAALETVLDPAAEPSLFAISRFNELAEYGAYWTSHLSRPFGFSETRRVLLLR
jgi:hypothetical protein